MEGHIHDFQYTFNESRMILVGKPMKVFVCVWGGGG